MSNGIAIKFLGYGFWSSVQFMELSCQFVMWRRIKIKAPVSLCQSAKELSGSMHLDVQC